MPWPPPILFDHTSSGQQSAIFTAASPSKCQPHRRCVNSSNNNPSTSASSSSIPAPSSRAISLLITLFLLIAADSLIASPEVPSSSMPQFPIVLSRYSCREHFLNGHANNGVLPIQSPSSGTVFWLECRFPPASTSQSARLSVQTVVNNALVGQWLDGVATTSQTQTVNDQDGKQGGGDVYLQQQVTDRDFLHKLIMDSDQCSQQIQIQWPPTDQIVASNESTVDDRIVVETFGGQKLNFHRNFSVKAQYLEILPLVGQSAPVRRIGMPLPKGAALTLGPLICRQMLIPRAECHFELRTDSDQIRLKLPALRRQSKTTGSSTLSIAFRTSKPNGRLLELLDGGNGPLGALDLVDGYLLLANHITHPVKLLADGLWHSLHLDLHSLSVRVDDLLTSLSLRATADEEDQPQYLDILAHGELGALRLVSTTAGSQTNGGGSSGDGKVTLDGSWICLERNDLLNVRQSVGQQYIFARPSVCSPSASEKNFCNCQGPNSAMAQNGGIGRQKITAQCALLPDQQNAVHLTRLADRLAFLLVPNFGPKAPISVLFSSEQPTGLVFFGTFSTLSSSAHSPSSAAAYTVFHAKTTGRSAKSSNGMELLGGRVQAHFVGRTMFGAICMQMADGSEKCLSCSIQMDKDFMSTSWTRVSLFYQLNYQFMTVNERICLLSPNSHAVDPAELYRISTTNVLLVGGAFYTKHLMLSQRVNTEFRRDFQDNTREKAPSLAGCVGDILVRGQRQNLSHLLAAQIQRAKWHNNADARAEHEFQQNDGSIFSINIGCADCPDKCNGAHCIRHWFPPPTSITDQQQRTVASCQCSSIYTPMLPATGECQTADQQHLHAEHHPILAHLPIQQQIGDQEILKGTRNGLRLSVYANDRGNHEGVKQQIVPFSVPIRSPLTPTAWGRARHRLDRIWMLFRLPERNLQMHPFIIVGGIHISIGEHGHRVVIEAKEYGLMEEFQLSSQPLDSRLHLLSVERNSGIGTSITGGAHMLTIRLDNALRDVHLEEIPIASIDGQPPKIEVRPLVLAPHSGDVNEYEWAMNGGGGGCIRELIFHYAQMDEELSTIYLSSGTTTTMANNQFQQIDYVNQFREQFPLLASNDGGNGNGIVGDACAGVIDSSLWLGNSSSWGRLSKNDEWQNGPMAFILRKTTTLARFSLLITCILILLVLVCLSFYMFHAIRRHYMDDQSNSPSNRKCSGATGKKHFDQMHAAEHERRPLKLVMEEGEQTDSGNRQTRNGNVKNTGEIHVPPSIPPKSPRAVVNGWSNSRRTDEQPPPILISSNASPNVNPPLRVTPLLLRSQPLRSSRNTLPQSPYSQKSTSPTITTNNSIQDQQQQEIFDRERRGTSAEFMQISPLPSTILSGRQNGGMPHKMHNSLQSFGAKQWSSSGGESAGFFTPSPLSSSTSPGSDNSLQGHHHSSFTTTQFQPHHQHNELIVRPPFVRVAATMSSRQHSPNGAATNGIAPIACKDEL